MAAGVPAVLQWGRDRAVAELLAVGGQIANYVLLQWGRDRAVAELRTRLTLRSCKN